jgi:hypothetical protein
VFSLQIGGRGGGIRKERFCLFTVGKYATGPSAASWGKQKKTFFFKEWKCENMYNRNKYLG